MMRKLGPWLIFWAVGVAFAALLAFLTITPWWAPVVLFLSFLGFLGGYLNGYEDRVGR